MNRKFPQNDIFLRIVKDSVRDFDEKKIQIFDDGWDYVVIVVNDAIAFRFPRREDYSKTLPTEVKFLESFEQLSPVKIPKLSYKQDRKTGVCYVTYPFISGVQFTKSFSATLSKDEIFTIAKQLGLFLTAMHSFPIEKAEQLGIRRVDLLESWKKRLRKIEQEGFPHIPVAEQMWVKRIPEHIIVNPENHTLSGIIDFGDIEIGDPAYDFTFLALYGRDFLNEVYRNYGLPRDNSFEKRR